MAITLTDPDGKVLLWGPSAESLFGWKAEEVIGQQLPTVLPDKAEEFQVLRDAAAKGQVTTGFETQAIKKNGMVIDISLSVAAVHTGSGKTVGLVWLLTDITERKRAEAEVQRSLKQWEDVFQSVGDATLILDLDYRILAANRAVLTALGRRSEEVLGKHCYEIYHSAGEPSEKCPVQQMKKSQNFVPTTSQEKMLGGDFLVSCTPVFDETGRVAKMIHIATDITERQRSQEAVQRYRAMVEGAQDCAIIMLDANGTIINWSEGAKRIFGHKAEEVMGQPYSCLFSPGEIREKRPIQLLERGAAQGHFELDEWRPRKDGSQFWVNAILTRLQDVGGRLIGFSLMVRDLTERKKAEDEIKRLNQDLAQRVVERTAQLEEANKELKAVRVS